MGHRRRAATSRWSFRSHVVPQLVAELDATWRHMLARVLSSPLVEPELRDAVGALIATIQGAFLQPMSSAAGA